MCLHLCFILLVFLTQLKFIERIKGVTCSRRVLPLRLLSSLLCPSVPEPAPGTCWQRAWQPQLDFSGAGELTAFAEQQGSWDDLCGQSPRLPSVASAPWSQPALALQRTPALARMGPEAGAGSALAVGVLGLPGCQPPLGALRGQSRGRLSRSALSMADQCAAGRSQQNPVPFVCGPSAVGSIIFRSISRLSPLKWGLCLLAMRFFNPREGTCSC